MNLEDARAIADSAVKAIDVGRPLQLLDAIEEVSTHWVFHYNDARYVDTGDPLFDYLEGGPVAVAKADGELTWLVSWVSAGEQLETDRAKHE